MWFSVAIGEPNHNRLYHCSLYGANRLAASHSIKTPLLPTKQGNLVPARLYSPHHHRLYLPPVLACCGPFSCIVVINQPIFAWLFPFTTQIKNRILAILFIIIIIIYFLLFISK